MKRKKQFPLNTWQMFLFRWEARFFAWRARRNGYETEIRDDGPEANWFLNGGRYGVLVSERRVAVSNGKLTTDPSDPRLGHGVDNETVKQHETYLILSDEERAKGFVRAVRRKYIHKVCGVVTTMNEKIAETYARDPKFYGATYCCGCEKHLPVSEFLWDGTNERVGS